MKILLTGNAGFVGSHIQSALESDGYEIVGFEATPKYLQWMNDLLLLGGPFDAVVHAGAISSNQYSQPDIFLWNSYATFEIAKYVRDKCGHIPFVFFSSFQVSVTEKKERSWYGWSKVFAEDCIKEVLPASTILRPGVMWGDERNKKVGASVPYLLASRRLEFLYKDWGRDYIYIDDVIDAVRIGIHNRPAGVFNLNGEYWKNLDLARLTDWNDYNLLDRIKTEFHNSEYKASGSTGSKLPDWERRSNLVDEFRRIESIYNDR